MDPAEEVQAHTTHLTIEFPGESSGNSKIKDQSEMLQKIRSQEAPSSCPRDGDCAIAIARLRACVCVPLRMWGGVRVGGWGVESG